MQLPELLLDRFVNLYEELNSERRWFEGAEPLRFAAMTALCCPGSAEEVSSAIRDISDEIKSAAGVFGELNSPLRFILAAMLLVRGDSAQSFLDEAARVRELYRAYKLRRGGVYEIMAAMILRDRSPGGQVDDTTIARFRDLYEEMKRHHWWLTGPDDFPACALLVGEPGEVRDIGNGIEEIYQALQRSGFSTGDPLQTASNILYLSHLAPRDVADRYRGLADAFRTRKVAIWQSDYDELAILSFLDHEASVIADRVVERRAAIKSLKPDPGILMTFNLAASIAFLELVQVNRDLQMIQDAKALLDMQAVIAAQQAASAAAAASVASTAATSSS